MFFPKSRKISRVFVLVSSIIIIGLFLYNVSIFFDQIKEEERNKMEVWGEAYKEIINSDYESSLSNLVIPVMSNNTSTPMIVHGVNDDSYSARNISENKVDTKEKIKALAEKFETQYQPLVLKDEQGNISSIVYYGYSNLLTRLQYFPIIIILIVILFLGIIYYFYITSKQSEQSLLWAGMAKETAHQIGTPLSSLVGWKEILKSENVNPTYLEEIDKDIARLQVITERFSKIGSMPNLEVTDIVAATKQSFEYLKNRSSRLIHFSIKIPNEVIYVSLNEQLYSWTIENLVKNSIDALKGKGDIEIELTSTEKDVSIFISDNGKGIPKSLYNKVFTPGFTTKQRGWGLGLSLARRIIVTYHGGKIKVLKSELNKGTTFLIKLNRA
ncbi:PAS domain-containing sensor histidine kinase [Mesonia sp. K7]|uniref:sensor histidine kinase n=1 Tax=Mesonia sp. K7 TaxID=2218606 RepID=UPI000DA827CA|nr:HAMP domain-containing sensor histidine kinase [Mesonia sp. K7]PZD77760.1 sensor histidine kinase [Mesonia sp. K7]